MPTNGYTRNETVLCVEHVSLAYGDRLILRDVNVEVKNIVRPDCSQGQVICFLGPSGIGKTQLSRVIAGLQRPTEGQVTLLNGKPVERGAVGMVPQNYLLFEFATVSENLHIAMKQSARPRHIEQFNDYVAKFELEKYLSYYPKQLSGGTRQRVAIVRQLLCSDHFIVMDEPFSGLDPIMKRRACEVITQVANLDELNTIIIVTHDVTEGMSVADTVWLMGREAGQPGARILTEYDLAERGLCWDPELIHNPEFLKLVAEVKDRFQELV